MGKLHDTFEMAVLHLCSQRLRKLSILENAVTGSRVVRGSLVATEGALHSSHDRRKLH